VGSYLRLIDFCITQLKAQGLSRTCNESKEDEENEDLGGMVQARLRSRLVRERRAKPDLHTPIQIVESSSHARSNI